MLNKPLLSLWLFERNVICSAVFEINEDMILALAAQYKQLSHEPEKIQVKIT